MFVGGGNGPVAHATSSAPGSSGGPDLFAIATWGKDRSEAEYLDRVLCEKWEVVLPELTFEPRNSQ